jgi:hypothetical protein
VKTAGAPSRPSARKHPTSRRLDSKWKCNTPRSPNAHPENTSTSPKRLPKTATLASCPRPQRSSANRRTPHPNSPIIVRLVITISIRIDPPPFSHASRQRSARMRQKDCKALNGGATQAVFHLMNARPRLHLLLASMLLWAAIPLLKVCCFGVVDKSPTCCARTERLSDHDTAPRPPAERHSAPCCSGSSYLAKEDTSVSVNPSVAPSDHLAPPGEKIEQLLTNATNAAKRDAPTGVRSSTPASRSLAITLRTCCAPNAPPNSIA